MNIFKYFRDRINNLIIMSPIKSETELTQITKFEATMPLLILGYPKKVSSLSQIDEIYSNPAYKEKIDYFMSTYLNVLLSAKKELLSDISILNKNKHVIFESAAEHKIIDKGGINGNLIDAVIDVELNLMKQGVIPQFKCYNSLISSGFIVSENKTREQLNNELLGDYNYYIADLRNKEGFIDKYKEQLTAFNTLWLYTTDVIISSILELIDAIELAKSRLFIHIMRGIEWGMGVKNNLYNNKDPFLIDRYINSLIIQSRMADNYLKTTA